MALDPFWQAVFGADQLKQNPNYDPSGIDPFGSDNPYLRPSFWKRAANPQLAKEYRAWESQPFQQNAEINQQVASQSALTPGILGREAANRASVWSETQAQHPTHEAWRQESMRSDIPINAEQAAATHKAITDEKSKQATSEIIALQRTPLWASMPEWIKRMSPEDAGAAIGNDPRLSNIHAQSMAQAGLQTNIPEISAAQQKARLEEEKLRSEEELKTLDSEYKAKRAQHEFSGRQTGEENRLGVPENLGRQAAFSSTYGFPAAALGDRRTMYPVGAQGVTEMNDPFYKSKMLGNMQDMQSLSAGLKKSPLGAGVEAAGYGKVRPTLGYSGDVLSSSAALPPSLQQGVPLATQVSTAPATQPQIRPSTGLDFVMRETGRETLGDLEKLVNPLERLAAHGAGYGYTKIKPQVDAAKKQLREAYVKLRKYAAGGTE